MRTLSLGVFLALLLAAVSHEAKAAGCDAIGNVRFICDQVGPEDLVPVPGSEWVLSSGMLANGAIRAVNLRDKTTAVLFPSATAKERPNKKVYATCPGPIGNEGDRFRAHGLYLRPGKNAVHTLFVVHHGDHVGFLDIARFGETELDAVAVGDFLHLQQHIDFGGNGRLCAMPLFEIDQPCSIYFPTNPNH